MTSTQVKEKPGWKSVLAKLSLWGGGLLIASHLPFIANPFEKGWVEAFGYANIHAFEAFTRIFATMATILFFLWCDFWLLCYAVGFSYNSSYTFQDDFTQVWPFTIPPFKGWVKRNPWYVFTGTFFLLQFLLAIYLNGILS